MPFRTAKTDVWQYDIIVGGHRLRGSTGTKDKEEAKTIEARIRADAKAKIARGNRYTIGETIGTYYRDVAQHQPSAATTASQGRNLLKVFKPKMMADLTTADLMSASATMRATRANGTVNRHMQMLARAIRHMVKVYDADAPTADFAAIKTKEPKERIRELSGDEQARLFEALPSEMQPFVKFALLTGARIGTIARLKWSDVDFANDEMTFHLKGDDSMVFPITSEIRALLSALPRSNVLEHRRLVFTRVHGKTAERIAVVSNGGVFNDAWRKAVADAEIDDFHFHDLRHTFATRTLRAARNLKLVSKLLGHKNIETTTKYVHVLMDDKRAAFADFSPLSGGIPQNSPQTTGTKSNKTRGFSK